MDPLSQDTIVLGEECSVPCAWKVHQICSVHHPNTPALLHDRTLSMRRHGYWHLNPLWDRCVYSLANGLSPWRFSLFSDFTIRWSNATTRVGAPYANWPSDFHSDRSSKNNHKIANGCCWFSKSFRRQSWRRNRCTACFSTRYRFDTNAVYHSQEQNKVRLWPDLRSHDFYGDNLLRWGYEIE